MTNLDDKRTLVNAFTTDYQPYGLQGEEQSDISWHNISWNEESQSGFFLVKFRPGGSSIPHEHLGYEEFVILEGDLVDSDGAKYVTGDCVSLESGSRHYSTSEIGATIAVFIRGGFRTIDHADL